MLVYVGSHYVFMAV